MDLATLTAQAHAWMERDPDPRTRKRLAQWLGGGDTAALARAFAGRVRFGTAGLRAEVGPGPAHINALVIRQSAAGVARVLAADGQAGACVAVGYDGRTDSAALAQHAAGVLRAAGHPVALFDTPSPTPLIGFWVKQQQLAAGLVITASHNPPRDNGLKVYWQGGTQIAPPVDARIAHAIDGVASALAPVPYMALEQDGPAVHRPAAQALLEYCAALKQAWPVAPGPTTPVRIAYTPLHGVGAHAAARALRGEPVQAWHVVEQQAVPDGAFPTLQSPNPEDPSSLAALLALADAKGCELACANDPDADRLAVAVRAASGALEVLTGDEIGALLAAHLLEHAPAPTRCLLASSCVSSRLLGRMATAHGATHVSTLPGFKWLAQALRQAPDSGLQPLFAYEEALGFAPTTLVWDKDGISSLVLVVRLAAALKAQGQSLLDALAALHARYGLSVTAQSTLRIEGGAGGASGPLAAAWMQSLRAHAPAYIGPMRVTAIDDGLDAAVGSTFFGLPKSDGVALQLADPSGEPHAPHVRIVLRPSGTEPKLKAYYEAITPPVAKSAWATTRAQIQAQLRRIQAWHRPLVLAQIPAEGRA